MKKILITLLMFLLAAGALWSRSYRLNESEDIDLSGIDTVIIDINSPSCIVCVKTLDIDALVEGGERDGNLSASLQGTIRSNRKKAVPELLISRQGDDLRISLYPEHLTVLGLVSSGTAEMTVRVPAEFEGAIEAFSASDNITLSKVTAESVTAEAGSGNITAESLQAGTIELTCSSGNLELDDLSAVNTLTLKASSGDIRFGTLAAGRTGLVHLSSGTLRGERFVSGDLTITNSSGNIEIDSIETRERLYMEASSGNIRSKSMQGQLIELENHSGQIEIEDLKGRLRSDSSSGDVTIGLYEITDDMDIHSSSGNIRVTLPEGSRYSVNLSASSENIKVEDPVMGPVNSRNEKISGDVNGGGPLLTLRSSSGNISMENR